MLRAAVWVLGAVALGGLGLSCFYLLERPIRGAARVGSWVHGGVGALGVGVLLAALAGRPADPDGFKWIAGGGLGLALVAGVGILAMQWRGRRPAGLVVALHVTLAVGGYVILLAYASLAPVGP